MKPQALIALALVGLASPLRAQDMGTEVRTEADYDKYLACIQTKAGELNAAGETVESTVSAAKLKCEKQRFDVDWAVIEQVQQESWSSGQDTMSRLISEKKAIYLKRATDGATLHLFNIRAKIGSNAAN